MVNDPIADFLVQIKNAGTAGKKEITVPYSDIKLRIANVLEKKGFLGEVTKKADGNGPGKVITIALLYDAPGLPRVRGVRRMSRPSRRHYAGAKSIRPVHEGHGVMVLSTPKGVMSGDEAKKEHVGGEVLCIVW